MMPKPEGSEFAPALREAAAIASAYSTALKEERGAI
jgi:hypothetical protein